jgi:hypothetical protein
LKAPLCGFPLQDVESIRVLEMKGAYLAALQVYHVSATAKRKTNILA